LDKNDQRLLRLMTKRVGVALRGQSKGQGRCPVRTRAGAVYGVGNRPIT
jgi:hypothetical protein